MALSSAAPPVAGVVGVGELLLAAALAAASSSMSASVSAMSDVAWLVDGVVVVARPRHCAAEAPDARRRGARRRRNIEAALLLLMMIEQAIDVCGSGKRGCPSVLCRCVCRELVSVMRGFVPSWVVSGAKQLRLCCFPPGR